MDVPTVRAAAVRRSAENSTKTPSEGLDPRFALYRKSGDRGLRNALIEEHRWLALHCARRYANRGEPLDDLVQVAMVGVLKAVERFDPGFGTKFS
ncbi:MAG TPA: sigma factor, partial [Acidimicrobiales bacterium]|nr:sigma factor [Acidimicrobiales bacterium]